MPQDHQDAEPTRFDWLANSHPDDWHRMAIELPFTYSIPELEFIVSRDDCDLATALVIFWKCEPGWDLMLAARGEAIDREEAGLVKYIADRICRGGYKRKKIAFDAEPGMKDDYKEMRADLEKIENPPWQIHKRMIRSIWGREVYPDGDFYRRYPEQFVECDWVDLSQIEVFTPNMEDAAKSLRYLLLQSLAAGFAIRWVVAFLMIGIIPLWSYAVGAFLFWHILGALRTEIATIRALRRENRSPGASPWLPTAMIGSMAIGLLLGQLTVPIWSAASAYGVVTRSIVIVALLSAVFIPVHLIARRVGRYLVRRKLFA